MSSSTPSTDSAHSPNYANRANKDNLDWVVLDSSVLKTLIHEFTDVYYYNAVALEIVNMLNLAVYKRSRDSLFVDKSYH